MGDTCKSPIKNIDFLGEKKVPTPVVPVATNLSKREPILNIEVPISEPLSMNKKGAFNHALFGENSSNGAGHMHNSGFTPAGFNSLGPYPMQQTNYIPQFELKKEAEIGNDGSKSSNSMNYTLHFKGLDSNQIRTIENFTSSMDRVQADALRPGSYDQHRDEDIIILGALTELVNRYFGSQENPDNIGNLMRSKIPLQDMVSMLASVRFKEKGADMIFIRLKQMTDNLMELLLNPGSFHMEQITSQNPGRSIINIFIFLIKSYFQQVRILKSIYCDDMPTPENQMYLFSQENTKSVRRMVAVSLELCMQETLKRSGAASAFQLHSQRMEAADSQPFMHVKEETNRGVLMSSFDISNNYLDKNLLSLQKSAQLKRLSFEIAGSLRSDLEAVDLERALKDSGQNMNKFVSNLLRKNLHDE